MKLLKALAGKTIFVIIAIILQIAIYLLLANLVERLILAIPWEVDIPARPRPRACRNSSSRYWSWSWRSSS